MRNLLSENEFLNLPESICKQELLEGELDELPPANHWQSELARRIFWFLDGAAPRKSIWTGAYYRLCSRKRLAPDVSVSWPDQGIEDDSQQGAPMLAIEIASRGNTAEELERKRVLYLEHGAAEVWIIYPNTHTMLVSRRDGTIFVEAAADYRCELLGVAVTPEYRTPAA